MKSIIGVFSRLFDYLKGAKQEVKKVNWPTGPDVMRKTIIVIAFSAVVTAILGGFDVLFNEGMLKLFETQGARQVETLSPELLDAGAVDIGAVDGDGNSIPVEVVGNEESVEGVIDDSSVSEIGVEEE